MFALSEMYNCPYLPYKQCTEVKLYKNAQKETLFSTDPETTNLSLIKQKIKI